MISKRALSTAARMTLPFPSPASLAPGFSVARCTPADIPQMISCYNAAFLSTNFTYWWPADLEVMRRWTEGRFRLRFHDPSEHHFKVSDVATGQIVAWARWVVPVDMKGLAVGFRTFEGDDDSVQGVCSEAEWMRNPPAGSNEELYHEFFQRNKASECFLFFSSPPLLRLLLLSQRESGTASCLPG